VSSPLPVPVASLDRGKIVYAFKTKSASKAKPKKKKPQKHMGDNVEIYQNQILVTLSLRKPNCNQEKVPCALQPES
jgi:hypothetical protein